MVILPQGASSKCVGSVWPNGLKTGNGSLRGIMADEEGMSASADGSGVCSFLCVMNGIFLVGESVRDG